MDAAVLVGRVVDRRAQAVLVGRADRVVQASTMEQLDDNLGALDVHLSADQAAALDKATTPTLSFPADMLAAVPSFAFGGTTVNGQPSAVFPLAPKNDSERF